MTISNLNGFLIVLFQLNFNHAHYTIISRLDFSRIKTLLSYYAFLMHTVFFIDAFYPGVIKIFNHGKATSYFGQR